jgi:hypothetical protein
MGSGSLLGGVDGCGPRRERGGIFLALRWGHGYKRLH